MQKRKANSKAGPKSSRFNDNSPAAQRARMLADLKELAQARMIGHIHMELTTAHSITTAGEAERVLLDQFRGMYRLYRHAADQYDLETGQPLKEKCCDLSKQIGQALLDGRIILRAGGGV